LERKQWRIMPRDRSARPLIVSTVVAAKPWRWIDSMVATMSARSVAGEAAAAMAPSGAETASIRMYRVYTDV